MSSSETINHCNGKVVRADRWDPISGESPAARIIETVASAAECDPLDLPPLFDFVDPETINRHVQPRDQDTPTQRVLTFAYADSWQVYLRGDGEIRVCDRSIHSDPRPVFGDEPLT